jgi:putative intracellular protease/amidase
MQHSQTMLLPFKILGTGVFMKSFMCLLAFSFSLSALSATKVLMMVPNDFMWPEYSMPYRAYKEAGFEVTLAGRFKEQLAPDRRNLIKGNPLYSAEAAPVKVDMTFEEVNVEQYDAITFVAGNGAWHDFFPNDVVHKILISSLQNNKVVGLLCASTGLLGLAGNYDGKQPPVAAGKRVVGYYRVEGLLTNIGKTNYIPGGRNEPAVQVDGNLVTGRNPESSQIFADKIVEVLNGRSPSSSKKK